jgi:hypothetical protein
MIPHLITLLALSVLLVYGSAAGPSAGPPAGPPAVAVFVVDSCPDSPTDETYRLAISDPEMIAEAERLIDTGELRIPIGELRRGSGGFNLPWRWHIDPATVEFADQTIEVCDGCASIVQDDIPYWVNDIGYFCPWSAVVLYRER